MTNSYLIPGGTIFRDHAHESTHLCAVIDGGMSEAVYKGTEELGPGSIRLSPASRHRIDFGPDTRCLVFAVDDAAVRPLRRSVFFRGEPRLARLARAADAATRRPGPDRGLILDDVLAELLAQIERIRDGRTAPTPPWLVQVRDMLHDTPGPTPVSDLARGAGVHRVHLARAFRDHYGISVTRYAQRLRLRRAIDLLVRSSEPISVVAARTGYADQSHLTRTVRSVLGTTPSRIRRQDVTSVQDPHPSRG